MIFQRTLLTLLGCSVVLNMLLTGDKTKAFKNLGILAEATEKDNASVDYAPSEELPTPIQDLRILLKTYNESNRTDQLFISNYIPRTIPSDENEITLVTHTSALGSKWNNLLAQMDYWRGPVSVAILITSEESIFALQELVENNGFWSNLTSIHIMIEPPQHGLYPHNLLRNQAMEATTSDYFLALDVDFIPPIQNCHAQLQALMKKNPLVPNALKTKTLLIFPAFEVFPLNGTAVAPPELLPTSKQHLKELVKEKHAAPFHLAGFKLGHGATDFQKWFNNGTSASSHDYYSINYVDWFEPYVMGYRPGIPRYWNAFRGFGFNKQSWVMELNRAGYKFGVLMDYYVAHLNHPNNDRRSENPIFQANHQVRNIHLKYLERQYPRYVNRQPTPTPQRRTRTNSRIP